MAKELAGIGNGAEQAAAAEAAKSETMSKRRAMRASRKARTG